MLTFNSPLEAFLHWESKTPNRIFIKQPINGEPITYTFREAKDEASKIADPISDGRGSAEYKKDVIGVLVARGIMQSMERLGMSVEA